jgi:hypothetical protein
MLSPEIGDLPKAVDGFNEENPVSLCVISDNIRTGRPKSAEKVRPASS